MQGEADILKKAAAILDDNIRKEFRAQGHHLTGAWENSVKSSVVVTPDGAMVEGFANTYGSIVNAGTTPARIPFGGTGTGNGGTSKYIQGLINYFKLRGLSDKEAVRAAFATAHVQKREGMSTIGSRQYSGTGERQRYLEATERAIGSEVDQVVYDGCDELIDTTLNEPVTIEY